MTLLFNVLVTSSPKEVAGDVGSLRGTTNNLAAAVGTAVAGALLVGLLSAIMLGNIAASPKLTPELQAQVDLDSINFISNDRLQTVLAGTTASPAQVAEAVRVNTESRLRALKIGLLIMAGLAFVVDPSGRTPAQLPSRRNSRGSSTARGGRDKSASRRRDGARSTRERRLLRKWPARQNSGGSSHSRCRVSWNYQQRTRPQPSRQQRRQCWRPHRSRQQRRATSDMMFSRQRSPRGVGRQARPVHARAPLQQ